MLVRTSVPRLVVALAVVAIVAVVAGCGGGGGGGDGGGEVGETPTEIVGVITEVSRSQGRIDRITMRTDEGETQDITLDPNVDYGFDDELLDQHQEAGNRLRVSVERRNNRLYATVILNA